MSTTDSPKDKKPESASVSANSTKSSEPDYEKMSHKEFALELLKK